MGCSSLTDAWRPDLVFTIVLEPFAEGPRWLWPKRALIAHATQVDPNGGFFTIPLAVQRAAWPTEDFELVESVVDTTLPEDDLFAGVREKVAT